MQWFKASCQNCCISLEHLPSGRFTFPRNLPILFLHFYSTISLKPTLALCAPFLHCASCIPFSLRISIHFTPILPITSLLLFPWDLPPLLHQQNVKWFGSHNWTTQQLWMATLILPDAWWCSQIAWVWSNVLSDALKLLHQCSSLFLKLWNRIQGHPEECIVLFKIL